MRSSDGRAAALSLALFALALLCVDWLRPGLAERVREVRRTDDAVVLPPAEMTPLLSLGYRAALADLIFAHVLVAYGQHFQEKRRFGLAASYLDAITTLDPRFREAYRLADTLITLQPKAPRLEDYRAARRLQERGLGQFPYDSELWLVAGQFLAYLAANHVPEAEQTEWRMAGAKALARSCELVGSNENIPHHCITAALLYNEAGRREAARSFLERVLAVSDDPEIQALAAGYLGRTLGRAERERVEERNQRFRALWARDLTFVSREALLLLGPRFDTGLCAGVGHGDEPACATSFRAWSELVER